MVYSVQTKNNQFRNILGKKIVRYNEYQDDRKHQDFDEIPRKYMQIKKHISYCFAYLKT